MSFSLGVSGGCIQTLELKIIGHKLCCLTWGMYHKTYYGRDESCSAISQCLCYCQSLFTGFSKHTSFVCYGMNYGCNKFYDTGPCGQCYKTFYSRNLRIFAQSQCVCQNRLEKLARDKHSSLVQKFVNYRQKMFYNIGPQIPYPHLLTLLQLPNSTISIKILIY